MPGWWISWCWAVLNPGCICGGRFNPFGTWGVIVHGCWVFKKGHGSHSSSESHDWGRARCHGIAFWVWRGYSLVWSFFAIGEIVTWHRRWSHQHLFLLHPHFNIVGVIWTNCFIFTDVWDMIYVKIWIILDLKFLVEVIVQQMGLLFPVQKLPVFFRCAFKHCFPFGF